jgi:hypothetical protein
MSTDERAVQSVAQRKTRGAAGFRNDLMAAIEYHDREEKKTNQIYKFAFGGGSYYVVATNKYQAAETALEMFFEDIDEEFSLKLVSRGELVKAVQLAAKREASTE